MKEKVEKLAVSGVDRDKLVTVIENSLSGNELATMKSVASVAKQVCVTDLVTSCNKDGKEQALVWLGDHIYTIHSEGFIKAVKDCLYTFDKSMKLSEVPSSVIVEMDLTDKATMKLVNSDK